MKKSRTADKINMLLNRISDKLKLPKRKLPRSVQTTSQEKIGFVLDAPHSVAYSLIGNRTDTLLPLFKDLDSNLESSGLKIGFKAYVSLTVFVSALVALSTLACVPLVLFYVLYMELFPAILFGVGGSLFAIALSVIGLYAFPIYRADVLKRGLEDELSFTTGYMAILAGAGVSPEKMFHSLSNLSVPLTVSPQAKDIIRDVNLFGSDIISALDKESKRTPSERFREMLEGLISTIHSGGDLGVYLREKSREYMKLKRISLKKFSDTLSMLSEVYVAVLLTGPLMLVIMLSVMAMLGGGDLGLLSPDLLLNMLTYIGIPVGALIFLVILDSTSPKW